MNKQYTESQVISLTRKIHPQDLGGETSKLENILRQALEEVVAEERTRVVELIKSRKPNEYAVRQYKTMEARTWDEKNLVIEALDDLLSSLDKPDKE